MFKFVILAAFVAAANAVLAPTPYGTAVTSQHGNILRSYGNLGQVSTYSKTIDTPYSSVSKSDVRVSNPGVYGTHAYAAPIAPIAHGYHGYAAPAYHGYAAPAYHGYAAPAVAKVAAPASLLGVAYSPAVAVSHMSYQAPAISYAW
ncbi:cuticle protein 67-like [Culicoides brevitarsis]|uniref:cuticle protein 67-like n=1 Tax=Culicoides brevitarsis TaxID=469753 RepID=UPI00307BA24A